MADFALKNAALEPTGLQVKKKILVFSLAYDPMIGGAEIAVKEIAERLKNFEFDIVTMRFSRNDLKREKGGNIKIYRTGFAPARNYNSFFGRIFVRINKYLFPFAAFLKASKLQKEKNYDAVWGVMANYAGFAAMFFKKKFKHVPYVLTLQEGDSIEHIKKRTRFIKRLYKKIFTAADVVQTISLYLREYSREIGYKGPVKIVSNGADVKHFSYPFDQEKINDLKKSLGKKGSDVFLITTSRLVPKNAVSDIILALTYLPAKFKLLVVGEGPEKEMLEKLVQSKRLEDRVRFIGSVKYEEVPKYLKASDIFVRPSLSEGFGNSFIEAMAARVPVIATPVGGIVDFLYAPHKDVKANVHQKPTGLFCEVKNPKSIAEKVMMLTENEELKKIIVENAFQLVFQKYDWDLVARHMENRVFRELFEKYSHD